MASRREGTTLGPYRLTEQIGRGGMATIYKAYQPRMERYVALKILPAHYAEDPKFVARFIQEARTIAQLEHRNILPVYDFGEEDGTTYLAMRYLEGGTLKELLKQGRLTLVDIDNLINQVCSALDYAHRKGVVHRDVKPANIMIDDEGAVYLMDFGIAKVLEGTGQLTETGAAIGTPAYMAPEQSMGKKVDARTDIYALGVILYEMIVGEAPYQADTPMAVALAHIYEPLPLPRDVNPEVPETAEAVIIKALAKEPDDRYQTTNELMLALTQAIALTDTIPAETTLSMLLDEVRATRKMPDVPVSSDIKIPTSDDLRVEEPTPTRSAQRGFPTLKVGFLALVAVVAIGVVIMVVLRPFDGQPVEVVRPEEQEKDGDIGGDISEGVSHPSDPSLYDSFDDPAFNGRINPELWISGGECNYVQQDGMATVTNTAHDFGSDCRLEVSQPNQVPGPDLGAFEARMRIDGDHSGGFVVSYLTAITHFEDGAYWDASCTLQAEQGTSWTAFEIQTDMGLPGLVLPEPRALYHQKTPAEYDRWYILRLEVDPVTMETSCRVDGKRLGRFIPDNASRLRDAPFLRQIVNFRSPGSVATAYLDDVRLFPPKPSAEMPDVSAGDEIAPPVDLFADIPPFDDFDDPAYNGDTNKNLWHREFDPRSYCEMVQQNGSLVVTKPTSDRAGSCGLIARPEVLRPLGSELESSAVKMQILSDHNNQYVGVELKAVTYFEDGAWEAYCGLGAPNSSEMDVHFAVIDWRLVDFPERNLYGQSFSDLRHDRWHTIFLGVDPQTMTFSCEIDGQLVGSFTPENAAELQGMRFDHKTFNLYDTGASGTVLLDDFRLFR